MTILNRVQGSDPIKYAIVSDRCGYVVFNEDTSDFSIFMIDKKVPSPRIIKEVSECVKEIKQQNFPDIYNL